MMLPLNHSPDNKKNNETPFHGNKEIERIGAGLLNCTLPKKEWTHAAHCAAVFYLLRLKPEIDLSRHMPAIIRSYNEATGVPNTQSSGYHETITQVFLRFIDQFLAVIDREMELYESVNFFLRTPFCTLDYLLIFYTRERLFSTGARRSFIDPDIRPLPRL